MPVIPELLVAHFQDLSINDFIALVLTHAAKVDAHPAVKEGTPEYFSTGEKLRALAEELEQWRDAAATGSRDAKAKKQEVWEAGKLALAMKVQYLTMLSLHRNDPAILHDTGFELKQRQQTTKPSVNLLAEIPEVTLKHTQSASGPVSGAITVVLSRPKNAPCELQMSYDPANESSWGGQGIHQNSPDRVHGS